MHVCKEEQKASIICIILAEETGSEIRQSCCIASHLFSLFPFLLLSFTHQFSCFLLLPQLPQRNLFIVMFIQDLRRRKIEIFLRNMHSPFPQCIHARLRAHAF